MSTLTKAGEFEHLGKTYSLFHRGGNANFQFRMVVDGKDTWKSLGTPVKAAALAKAKSYLNAIHNGNWKVIQQMQLKNEISSIGQILDRLEERKGMLLISSPSVIGYANALENLLKTALGKENVRDEKSTILSAPTVAAFISRGRAAGRPDHSLRSQLTQARCVLQDGHLEIFDGLKLPDLTGFRLKRKFRGNPEEGFRDFSAEAVRAMEAAAEELYQTRDPVWIPYVLMSLLGLRNAEVEKARWSDFAERSSIVDGKPVARRLLRVRAGYEEAIEAELEVEGSLWDKLISFHVTDADFVVPARTASVRAEICDRRINRFVEKFIEDRPKKSYELRKWAGSRVATRYGIYAAQRFLRHRSVTTTERYYATYLRSQQSASADDILDLYGETSVGERSLA